MDRLERQALDDKLTAHLKRWQDLLTLSAVQDRSKLAEYALKELYAVHARPCPQVFCLPNPYELAVVPPSVSLLASSAQWQALMEDFLKSGLPDSKKAGSAFDRAWRAHGLSELSLEILKRNTFGILGGKGSKKAVKVRVKEIMFKILLEQCRDTKTALCRLEKSAAGIVLDSQRLFELTIFDSGGHSGSTWGLDLELWYRRITLQRELALKSGLDVKEELFRSAFANGWFTPPSRHEFKALFHAGDRQFAEKARFIRRRFSDLESLSQRLNNWYSSLPLASGGHRAPLIWLPQAIELLPFALACFLAKPRIFSGLQYEIECWSQLSFAVGACVLHKDFAFYCPKPRKLSLDTSNRVHDESGPAAVWEGYEIYSWRARVVHPALIGMKDKLNVKSIRRIRNIEHRRLMIEIYGEERFLKDAGAKLLSKDEFGSLFILELAGDEPICMVRVDNSTPEADGSFKSYYLRVPPQMRSARQAVAWTFGMSESEYLPLLET